LADCTRLVTAAEQFNAFPDRTNALGHLMVGAQALADN
jgi:hypothetical protein